MLHISGIRLRDDGLCGSDGNSGSGHHNSGISAGSGSVILHFITGKYGSLGHAIHIANSDNKGSAGFGSSFLDKLFQSLGLASGSVITKAMVDIDLPTVNGSHYMTHSAALAPDIGSEIRQNDSILFFDRIMAQQQVAEFITVGQLKGSHPVIVLITSLFRDLRRRCAYILIADMVHGNKGSILIAQLIDDGIIGNFTSAPTVGCPVDDGILHRNIIGSGYRIAGEGGIDGD